MPPYNMRAGWRTRRPADSATGSISSWPDEPARKALNFERMSKGWVIGGRSFKKEVAVEHRSAAAALERGDRTVDELKDVVLQDRLNGLLAKLNKSRADVVVAGKSEPWKVALAAAMKANTTATNRWLAAQLHMGALHEVSRKVSAWVRHPDVGLARKLGFTTNHKT
jgi:hypothetical protein